MIRALVVSVTPGDVDVASDVLWGLGVVAVEERDVGDDVVELWTSIGDAEPPVGVLTWPWRFEDVDETVSETWRDFATVVRVADGLSVRPAWIDSAGVGDGVELVIEPGSTFGMGDHPTTQLSLRMVREVVAAGDTVLDVGTGSGVLAIAARRFGAGRAVGTDIAAASVAIGNANAQRNGVTDVAFTTDSLVDVDGPFDVVVANILAPTLIELSELLVAHTRRVLVISGLMDGRYQHVVDALAPLQAVEVIELDGWVAVRLERPSVVE